MDTLVVLALVALVVVAVVQARKAAERRRVEQQRLAEVAASRRLADDDTTRFGEELQELHWETLTDRLDAGMRQDYQRALDSYEAAKDLLRDATTAEQVRGATRALEDGRHALACVLARRDGRPVPVRRPPCFFDPAHGPAEDDAGWAPPGGTRRVVPVCRADADRLAVGAEPATRQVRRGDRMVPWWEGGPAYGAWAGGFYGGYAMAGLFPAFIVGSMLTSSVDPGAEYADAGALEGADGGDGDWGGEPGGLQEDPTAGLGDSGDYGGGDYGGDVGGGDFGGGDFGGGDFGGF